MITQHPDGYCLDLTELKRFYEAHGKVTTIKILRDGLHCPLRQAVDVFDYLHAHDWQLDHTTH